MANTLQKFAQDTCLQIQEAEGTPNKISPNKSTPKYIKVRLLGNKGKQKTLKAAQENRTLAREGKQFTGQ